MPILIEKLIDTIQALACVRSLESGKDLYFNEAYKTALQENTNSGYQSGCISEAVKKSNDVTTKAHFTFCKHLDEMFIRNDKKTTFAEEVLGKSKYYSMRTLINYKGSDAMFLIISKDCQPFSLDSSSINHIQ